ncbi:MAG: hypothetical protein Q9214_003166 [Letrouitia sp. 1 TL-2023]
MSSGPTPLKAGDKFPEGVDFTWVPYTEEKESITSCGVPQSYNASKEFGDKKIVLFAVPGVHTKILFWLPGAFTPGCSVRHLPGFIDNLSKIKSKGVDIVIVIAFNDAWVMSAWGKANGIKRDDIRIGWTKGDRTGRYAMVIDQTTISGKVTYAENEPGGDVTHKTLDVITLFHKASSPASIRAHTILKQVAAHASETATEDQATDHTSQNKFQRTEFELNITEDPPTPDQLRTILDYVRGGSRRADQLVDGAKDASDALRILREDSRKFKQPVTVDWNNGRAVIGDDESEILKMIRQLPKETNSV